MKNLTLDKSARAALVKRLAKVAPRDYFSQFEILYDTVKNHHESIGDMDEELSAELEEVMRVARGELGKS